MQSAKLGARVAVIEKKAQFGGPTGTVLISFKDLRFKFQNSEFKIQNSKSSMLNIIYTND